MQASHSLRELWPYHRGPHVYAGVIMGTVVYARVIEGSFVTNNPSDNEVDLRLGGSLFTIPLFDLCNLLFGELQ